MSRGFDALRRLLAAFWCTAGAAAASAPPARAQSGGDALLFVGTYDKSIYVIDEATERVTERSRCAPAFRARWC
jgi:hypothetical protein